MLYTTSDILNRHRGRDASEKVALVDGQRRVSYAELLERVQGYAALLQEQGLRRGDRVAIFLRRSVEAVVALFATQAAGAVAVVINESLRTQQVQYILEHSESSLLLTDSRQVLYIPGLVFDESKIICMDRNSPPSARPCANRAIGADLALIIYTSGSTGFPKGVMLSHNNLLSGAQIVSDYLNLTGKDRIISLLPFSFDYGLNQLLTALLVGGTLVIQRSLFPADICRTLQKESITGMAGVPTLWLQLVQDHSPFTKMSFQDLRYITNSGGRLPEQVVSLIRRSHPDVRVYLMYGLTEAFRSTFLPPEHVDLRPSSIGKAIPNVEILVINQEGHLCGPGEIGELVHRGANISMGYWRDPASSAQRFRPHPLQQSRNGQSEIVVFSGDLVKEDEEGYLYYVGRNDQLIKSSGFRVSPEEIEKCIFGSNLVSNVVAFAVPNGVDSEIIAAVIPKEQPSFREEQLHEFCKREMPEYMRPRFIWRLDQFPLTSSGKPDRCKLKDEYGERFK